MPGGNRQRHRRRRGPPPRGPPRPSRRLLRPDPARARLAAGAWTAGAASRAGVAGALSPPGSRARGACPAMDSDGPAGAGLSSSAALECAAALALTELAGLTIPRRELAAICRRAENEFVGVPSGIMDQSASLLGQPGHLLLLDCRSLDSSQVPFDPAPAGARLLLVNTRAKHDLSAGAYGQRRAECEQTPRPLGIPSFRAPTSRGETDRLNHSVLRRRARHIFPDTQPVLDVVALLRSPSGRPRPSALPDACHRVAPLLTPA